MCKCSEFPKFPSNIGDGHKLLDNSKLLLLSNALFKLDYEVFISLSDYYLSGNNHLNKNECLP